MKKFKCRFCGGYFETPVDRMEHIQERKSRCSLAAGNHLLEVFDRLRELRSSK